MKMTPSAKATEVNQAWLVVDATDLPLGRLSSEIAKRLMGKHKPTYTAHVDTGDHVVVINAEKVRLTGNKATKSKFYWHTGFVGGIKEITPAKTLETQPHRVIERGVERMLPKGTMGRDMFRKLHVYAGETHPHTAQQPASWDVATVIAKKNVK